MHSLKNTTTLMMRENWLKMRFSAWSKIKITTKVDPASNVKEIVKENSKDDPSLFILPNEPLNSKIVNYALYVKFWQLIPEFLRIRSPELIFRATDNGYNIHTFYSKCEEYTETYFFCLIFVKTLEGQIFGCLIDEMPLSNSRNTFQGSFESFVFSLEPEVASYKSTGNNEYHMLADLNYLAIGMGGDGPALRVDETLSTGWSYKCVTYDNQVLIDVADKFKNEFQVQDFEAFIF